MKWKCFLLILLPAVFFYSCEKEYSQESPTSTSNGLGNFIAKINGTQWVASQSDTAARGNGYIILDGISTAGLHLNINLLDSGVHRYVLNANSNNLAEFDSANTTSNGAFYSNTYPNQQISGGYVNVTSIDTIHKTISGSFVFNLFRPSDSTKLNFTEGLFTNIPYGANVNGGTTGGGGTTNGGGGTSTNGGGSNANAKDTFLVKKDTAAWPNLSLTVAPASGLTSVTSTGPGNSFVTLLFPQNIAVGSYVFDLTTYMALYSDGTIQEYAQGGNLTITSNDATTRRVSGKFNFKAAQLSGGTASSNWTEGSFSVSY